MIKSIAGLLAMLFSATLPAAAGLVFYFEAQAEPGRTATRLPEQSKAAYELNLRAGADRKTAPVPTGGAAAASRGLRLNRGLAWIKNLERTATAAPFTLNFEVRSASDGQSIPITAAGDWQLTLDYRQKKLRFAPAGQPAAEHDFPLAVNRWQMVSILADATGLALFLDAAPVGRIELAAAPAIRRDLYLGSRNSSGTGAADGFLRRLALWDGKLSPDQLRELKNGVPPTALPVHGLARTVTAAFPAELPDYAPVRSIPLRPGGLAIVDSDRRSGGDTAQALAEAFRRHWRVEVEIINEKTARSSGKTLLLWGRPNENALNLRLNALGFIAGEVDGYELRTLPDALGHAPGMILFGGRDRDEVMAAADAFFRRFPAMPEELACFVDTPPGAGETPPPPDRLLPALAKLYDDQALWQINQEAFNQLSRAARGYNLTGDEAYARSFIAMMRYVSQNYERGYNERKNPPTFSFHLFPPAVEMVERSPHFTAADGRVAAELMRRFIEETMAYWEMALPAEMYAIGRQMHFTNHYCFAARSVYFAAEFLARRYRWAPTAYWLDVSRYVFDNVSRHPISPEDAAGYQYLGFRIFFDFALASGLYDAEFFASPRMKEYAFYTKSLLSHRGFTAGYGDADPLNSSGGYDSLKMAVYMQNDAEAEYLLNLIARRRPGTFFQQRIDRWRLRRDLPPPGPASCGLNVFPLDEFRQKELRVFGLADRPQLDKAVFRSGWDDEAEFLTVTGIHNAPHGHFDANGISIFLAGKHLYLTEGHYIRKQTDDHNNLTIIRDGAVTDHRVNFGPGRRNRVSRIDAAVNTADRRLSLLAITLPDVNGFDHLRTVVQSPHRGFWVIDRLTARREGTVRIENRWRTLGKVARTPQGFTVRQRAAGKNDRNCFTITEGSGAAARQAAQFDAGHGHSTGYYHSYPYSNPFTQVVTQRLDAAPAAGETVGFVNFFRARRDKEQAPAMRRLAPDAYLMPEADFPQLLVMGRYQDGELEIDADTLLVNAEGVAAAGLRHFRFAGAERRAEGENVAWSYAELGLDPAAAAARLNRLATAGEAVANRQIEPLPLPEVKPLLTLEADTAIAHAMLTPERLALADGKVLKVFDHHGRLIFSYDCALPITRLAAYGDDFLVGAAVNRPEAGQLLCVAADGTLRWSREIPSYQKRSGAIRTLFTARLAADAPPAVIAGSDNWSYAAFDAKDGKQLWRAQILHGGTVGVAVDLDGDGLDEIYAGNEYYTRNLIDRTGKILLRRKTSPWDEAATALHWPGTAARVPVAGNADGFLYLLLPPDYRGPAKPWTVNAGGRPAGLAAVPGPDGERIAAATRSGLVSIFDHEGKRLDWTALPDELTALVRADRHLYAASRDGFVYQLDFAARPTARLAVPVDPDCPVAPQLAAEGKKLIAVSNRTLRFFAP